MKLASPAKTHNSPSSIESWLRSAAIQLKECGIDSARLDALLILEQMLFVKRAEVLAHGDTSIPILTLHKLNRKLMRRKAHEPLAYILGFKEFYGRDFMVNPAVLIPRPESESIITLLKSIHNNHISTVVDVGTGSGCLAVTAALELQATRVIGTDCSKKALRVASQNNRKHKACVQFWHANLLDFDHKKIDDPWILMTNLPYVPNDLVTSPEILKEPAQALFAGKDGLDLYRTLWEQVLSLDNKPRYVVTESLESQHTMQKRFAKTAGYELIDSDVLAQLFKLI